MSKEIKSWVVELKPGRGKNKEVLGQLLELGIRKIVQELLEGKAQ